MARKTALWLLWAGFISYVLLLAPPITPDTLRLIKNILTGQWTQVNPIILSIFSLIGIWILIYSCLLFVDGRMQKIRFWPFALGSAGTGVISLIPYLALREPNQEFSGQKDTLLKVFDSRWTGIILNFSTLFLLAFGLLAGDWAGFIQQFQSDRFVNGMSLAFCLFCLLFPSVLGDDMVRRGFNIPPVFWAVSLVPLLGPLAYLCIRPPLPDSGAEPAPESVANTTRV
ncbi:DUF2834 domain-containing protein [Trichocoleus sp. DQ-A3]|uniref:hypothetical protein n=1 Tax=Cyanophyceae TaxID=3028117 RepID=UPI001683889A|nr:MULTISPECIES: hypothetical protein [unclassified Coleofasciculus]MBD1898762.1 hypothetical protein [Coleofasciculus sp. FACHB-125]MBD2537901.1 hypothetical protein [Coleofasciculus sp. FACHB-SPT36]